MRPSYRTTLSVHPCVPTFDTSISHIHPSTHHLSLFLPPSHLFICICHLSVYPPTHPSLSIHPSIFSIIYPSSSLSFIHLSSKHLSAYLSSVYTHLFISSISHLFVCISHLCISHLCPSICLYLPPCVSFIYVCVSGSSRHLSIYQEREIIFKELAHAAVRAGRSKSSG